MSQINSIRKIFGELTMSGKMDQVKGRVKEAAGALADNDKLRREGKVDQAAALAFG